MGYRICVELVYEIVHAIRKSVPTGIAVAISWSMLNIRSRSEAYKVFFRSHMAW